MPPSPEALSKQLRRHAVMVSPDCYLLLRRLAKVRGVSVVRLVEEMAECHLGYPAKPVKAKRLQYE